MPLIVLFLVTLFLANASRLESTQDASHQEWMVETRHNRTIALAQLVNRYLDERGGVLPANLTLTTLAATPGYEDARQYLPISGPQADGPYLAVYPMNDGANTYKRVIVYNPPFDGSIDPADYLLAANNACGTTNASQPGNWCGNPKGSYWMTDTLSRISSEVARERAQQQHTLNKFAKVYSLNQIYPNPGSGNGSAVTLISLLSGYTMTAATCTGVWTATVIPASCKDNSASGAMACTKQWQTIPFTCDDLYTIWGTPRVYNYVTKDLIALYAEAPWQEAGLPIVVAAQLDSR